MKTFTDVSAFEDLNSLSIVSDNTNDVGRALATLPLPNENYLCIMVFGNEPCSSEFGETRV